MMRGSRKLTCHFNPVIRSIGFNGWAVCVSYLVLGTLVTKVKMAEKTKLGIAEKRGGARGPENVWGSAATVRVPVIPPS